MVSCPSTLITQLLIFLQIITQTLVFVTGWQRGTDLLQGEHHEIPATKEAE